MLEGWRITRLHLVLSKTEICGSAISFSQKYPTKKGPSPTYFTPSFHLVFKSKRFVANLHWRIFLNLILSQPQEISRMAFPM